MWLFVGTLLWSVGLCSQSSISCANGDRRSQIKKQVVVSTFSATGVGECGWCGGEVICHKNVPQSFLNQSLDPPAPSNQKFLDPPLENRPKKLLSNYWCIKIIKCSFKYYRKIHNLTRKFHVKLHDNRYRTNREARSAISVFKCNLTWNSRVRKWIFLESHNRIKIR